MHVLCSVRGCQQGSQRAEIMHKRICGTIWDGYVSLLGEISAETPTPPLYTVWLAPVLLVMKLKGRWVLRATYHLLEHDCGTFVTSQVARDDP